MIAMEWGLGLCQLLALMIRQFLSLIVGHSADMEVEIALEISLENVLQRPGATRCRSAKVSFCVNRKSANKNRVLNPECIMPKISSGEPLVEFGESDQPPSALVKLESVKLRIRSAAGRLRKDVDLRNGISVQISARSIHDSAIDLFFQSVRLTDLRMYDGHCSRRALAFRGDIEGMIASRQMCLERVSGFQV